MKNLKKVLAVVLVVVMAFSLVAMASAKTSFTDDKDIKFSTAVGVMTGIGAINGYADGSFNPKGEVTRAEAAKMVAYAVLGPIVAGALKTSTTSFSDVPATHWASPYIEWAVAQGVLNGLGDGTFNPNGKVTAFELAKMMLCAAGYGKNDEYVGPNWSINVATDGIKYEIFKDNESANFAAPATREEAALYIFNGIFRVHQVDYNELFGYYGKGYSVTSGTEGKTIAVVTYHMSNDKGIVVGGSIAGTAATGTDVCKAKINDEGKVTEYATATNYKFEAAAADMGQLVSIFVNTDSGKVYYTETVSKSVSVILATSTPTGYNNAFGSLTYAPAAAVVTFTANYAAYGIDNTATAAELGMTIGTVAPAGTYTTYGGQIIGYAASATTTFDKVTAISTAAGAESITFASLGQKSNKAADDKLVEYTGIAVGDYVTAKLVGTRYIIDKVTTVSGSISSIGYFVGMTWYVTMDGKQYSASGASGTADLTETFPSNTDFAKNTYTLYLDSAGNWITCVLKSGANAASVVYATGLTWAASGDYGPVYKAQCVNVAGEQVVYNMATNQTITGGFYSVSINSTTGNATLTGPIAASSTNFQMSANVAQVKATDVANQANHYYATDVKFIFVSGTGTNLKITTVTGLAAVAGIALDTTDGLFLNPSSTTNKTINTVLVSGAFTGATTGATVYFDNDAAADSYNATNTYYYAYIDGVRTKITAKDATLNDVDAVGTSVVGKFASYTVDANNVYDITGVSPATNVFAQQTIAKNGVYNNYFTVGANTYNATGATVVDLSQSFGEPLLYTSVAALAASTASKSFVVSFVTDAVTGVVKYIYVERAFDYTITANGITLGYTKTTTGTTDTYKVTLVGQETANSTASTITLGGTAAATWPAAGTYMPLPGMTRTSDTVMTFADGSLMKWLFNNTWYDMTFTFTCDSSKTITFAIA